MSMPPCPVPPKEPLLFQRSQTPLMQMITLHPEQHKRHRKQHQCHKQVKPTPSHKRKPHNPQNSYQCQCRPHTSKILVNENAPNRQLAPKYQNSPESCIIPQITPKFERLIHLSPLHLQSTNNLHEILYHVLGVLH